MMAFAFIYGQLTFATEIGFSYNSNTGDKELDLSLGELNINAKGDMDNFVKSLSVSYGVKQEQVEKLVHIENIPPADVYMVIKVSKVSGNPINLVLHEYKAGKGKGWGVIAKRLGIKPGSEAFHALKKDDSGILSQKGKDKKSKGKKPKQKSKGKKKWRQQVQE